MRSPNRKRRICLIAVALASLPAWGFAHQQVGLAATVGVSYVINDIPPESVTEYAAQANGNVSPVRTISGNLTRLQTPQFITVDTSGVLYVTNTSNTITEYAAGASGNVAPIRSISGTATGLDGPGGIILDLSGNIYVANSGGNTPNSVTVYAAGANGNVAPIRTISGTSTGLNFPSGLTMDGTGTLFVVNNGDAASITEYASGANGNVAPSRTISGPLTRLSGPNEVKVDNAGVLYVTNTSENVTLGRSVTEYAPGANGNVAPIREIRGSQTGLNFPTGLALDGAGTIYVTNISPQGSYYGGTVTEYAAGADGNVAPIRTIIGAQTGLNHPVDVAVAGGPAAAPSPTPSPTATQAPVQKASRPAAPTLPKAGAGPAPLGTLPAAALLVLLAAELTGLVRHLRRKPGSGRT